MLANSNGHVTLTLTYNMATTMGGATHTRKSYSYTINCNMDSDTVSYYVLDFMMYMYIGDIVEGLKTQQKCLNNYVGFTLVL